MRKSQVIEKGIVPDKILNQVEMKNRINYNMLIDKGDKLEVVIRRDERGHNDGSIVKIPFEGHAYCIAKAPRFATDEEWSHNAGLLIELLEKAE